MSAYTGASPTHRRRTKRKSHPRRPKSARHFSEAKRLENAQKAIIKAIEKPCRVLEGLGAASAANVPEKYKAICATHHAERKAWRAQNPHGHHGSPAGASTTMRGHSGGSMRRRRKSPLQALQAMHSMHPMHSMHSSAHKRKSVRKTRASAHKKASPRKSVHKRKSPAKKKSVHRKKASPRR